METLPGVSNTEQRKQRHRENRMGHPLTAAERETVIGWTDADDGMAFVYTCQRHMMRKLGKHPQAKLTVRHTDDQGRVTGEEYVLPVSCIRITSGKKRRVSEAQREHARRLGRSRNQAASLVLVGGTEAA